MDNTRKAQFATWLHGQGYRNILDLGDGRYAALQPLLFTVSIIAGRWGDTLSFDDRWCYRNSAAAKAALEAVPGVRVFCWHPADWPEIVVYLSTQSNSRSVMRVCSKRCSLMFCFE